MPEIWILRLTHRRERDKRVTTHVALVSRALGASGMIYSGDYDPLLEDKIKEVNERWGGDFKIHHTKNPIKEIKTFRKEGFKIIHLTMYGLSLNNLIQQLKKFSKIMIIVGSEKVDPIYFQIADYNVAVGNQPHSEIAAIAIFLDRYYEGLELDREFVGGRYRIVPTERGKKVKKIND